MAFRSAGQHHAIVAIVYHLHPQKHDTQTEGSLLRSLSVLQPAMVQLLRPPLLHIIESL